MIEEKVAVLTDSGSDVPKEIVSELGIFVLPLQVNYKARSFRDGVEIDAQTVYEGLESEVPTTSLPLGSDLTELLEKIRQEGYTRILGVLLSSGLSGTYNMVRLAAVDAPDSHGSIGYQKYRDRQRDVGDQGCNAGKSKSTV
jgi:DegV family protein with EDD domain